MALKYETQVIVDHFDLKDALQEDCGIEVDSILNLFWPEGVENDSYHDFYYDEDPDPRYDEDTELKQKIYNYLRSLNLPDYGHIVIKTWW